jgi:broad specificity phosphatase PhoE
MSSRRNLSSLQRMQHLHMMPPISGSSVSSSCFHTSSLRFLSTIDADAYPFKQQQQQQQQHLQSQKHHHKNKKHHQQHSQQQHSSSSPPPPHKFLLPKRIILIRHGESLGNIDENAYSSIPDWKIPLTRRGERQALRAANELATLLAGESLFAYCSPYLRAKETWQIIHNYLQQQQEEEDIDENDNNNNNNKNNNKRVQLVGMREEPRIAEQQFGNFQNPRKVRTAKAERRTFGRFFFRFPNGEAGLDVYNRVSSFLATLSRDIRQLDERYSTIIGGIGGATTTTTTNNSTTTTTNNNSRTAASLAEVEHDSHDLKEQPSPPSPPSSSSSSSSSHYYDAMEHMNILVVCHGLTLRLLLMRYFQLTVEEFENSYNSQNAKLVIMERQVLLHNNNSNNNKGGRGQGGQREFYRLTEEAKQALNLKGDVSNERPVYWRMMNANVDNDVGNVYDNDDDDMSNGNRMIDRGLLLFDDDDNIDTEE